MRELVINSIRESTLFTSKVDSGEDVPNLETRTNAALLELYTFFCA